MKNAWGGIFIVTRLRTLANMMCMWALVSLFTTLQSAVTNHTHTHTHTRTQTRTESLIRSVQILHQSSAISCHLSPLWWGSDEAVTFRSRCIWWLFYYYVVVFFVVFLFYFKGRMDCDGTNVVIWHLTMKPSLLVTEFTADRNLTDAFYFDLKKKNTSCVPCKMACSCFICSYFIPG